jgi:hypothetical protein
MTMHKTGRLVLAVLVSSAFIVIAGCEGSGGFEQTLPDPPDGGDGNGGDGSGGGSGDGGDDGDGDGDPIGSFGADFQTIFNADPFEAPTDPDTITFVNVDFASDPVGVPDPSSN